LLAVWQGGSLGRGVPHFGRTPTQPIGGGHARVPSRGALGLPQHPADGPPGGSCPPNEAFCSSGDESTPVEKGEPRAESDCGPATSSESEEGNE